VSINISEAGMADIFLLVTLNFMCRYL